MTSERRTAGRPAISRREIDGVPADLAAGPAVELWADHNCHVPQWSAHRNWRDTRGRGASDNDLQFPGEYRHLPRALCDRAPSCLDYEGR